MDRGFLIVEQEQSADRIRCERDSRAVGDMDESAVFPDAGGLAAVVNIQLPSGVDGGQVRLAAFENVDYAGIVDGGVARHGAAGNAESAPVVHIDAAGERPGGKSVFVSQVAGEVGIASVVADLDGKKGAGPQKRVFHAADFLRAVCDGDGAEHRAGGVHHGDGAAEFGRAFRQLVSAFFLCVADGQGDDRIVDEFDRGHIVQKRIRDLGGRGEVEIKDGTVGCDDRCPALDRHPAGELATIVKIQSAPLADDDVPDSCPVVDRGG